MYFISIGYHNFATLNLKSKVLIPIFIACTGGDSCCTSTNKCDVDEGDCDWDSDCKAGLKCGSNNCKVKTGLDWDSKDDCCFNPG